MGTFNLGSLGVPRTSTNMTLMAAYGSNLDPALMAERVGPYVVFAVGTAPGMRLAFAGQSRNWGGPVATLVEDSRSAAPVVIYSLSKAQIEKMDANEGVARQVYRRAWIDVETNLGNFKVLAYLHNSPVAGKPTSAYVDVVRNGYRAFNLDESKLGAAIQKAR